MSEIEDTVDDGEEQRMTTNGPGGQAVAADAQLTREAEAKARVNYERKVELQRKIEDAEYEGWKVVDENEYSAKLRKRSVGSFSMHIYIMILTFFLGNIPYALYKFFLRPKKKVIRT